MIVYLVEHRTWSSSSIKKAFLNENKAHEFVNKLERNKTYSDGYVEYYVVPFEVEE